VIAGCSETEQICFLCLLTIQINVLALAQDVFEQERDWGVNLSHSRIE
jgi:hypothetical protein